MANIEIVALYVGLNALLLLVLAINVGRHRMRTGAIEPGATADHEPGLMRALRAQGNYIEYAPAVLLMLLVLAQLGYSPMALHIFGAVFTVGRVIHFVGMMQAKHPNPMRAIGTIATFLPLLVGAGLCIFASF